jgi:hypothetical protein
MNTNIFQTLQTFFIISNMSANHNFSEVLKQIDDESIGYGFLLNRYLDYNFKLSIKNNLETTSKHNQYIHDCDKCKINGCGVIGTIPGNSMINVMHRTDYLRRNYNEFSHYFLSFKSTRQTAVKQSTMGDSELMDVDFGLMNAQDALLQSINPTVDEENDIIMNTDEKNDLMDTEEMLRLLTNQDAEANQANDVFMMNISNTDLDASLALMQIINSNVDKNELINTDEALRLMGWDVSMENNQCVDDDISSTDCTINSLE